MSKKNEAPQAEEAQEAVVEETAAPENTELEQAKEALAKEHDQYLRLAAEYDNFRKRSQREKDGIYQDGVADTAKKFLPVYDNLERALANDTTDEAYKKGVQMIMNEFTKIMETLGITVYGAAGETFDPEKHNAVMHIEDDTLEENAIAEVFQKGAMLGDKVIRFAMVKVAN